MQKFASQSLVSNERQNVEVALHLIGMQIRQTTEDKNSSFLAMLGHSVGPSMNWRLVVCGVGKREERFG